MRASSQWRTRLGLGIEFLAPISFIVVGAEVVLFHVPAPKFLKELCLYPGKPQKIEEAKQNILKAHRERTGKDEPPKVLDCLAGGGAIPLEALRLS